MVINAAQICYTVVIALSKDMLKFRGVTLFEFAFFRSIINLISAAYVVKLRHKTTFFESVPAELWPTLVVRCLAGTLGFLVYNASTVYIPIGIFKIIMNMNIYMVAILAWLWLGEKLTCFEVVAILVAFGGVALTGKHEDPSPDDTQAQDNNYFLGMSLAVLASIMGAVTSVASRRLKTIAPNVIIFNYALCSTILTGSMIAIIWIQSGSTPYIFDSKWTYLEIFVAAFMNYVAQNFFTLSEQNGHPAIVKLFSYTGVVYMFTVGWLVFNDTISTVQLIGVSICVSSSLTVILYKLHLQRNQELK